MQVNNHIIGKLNIITMKKNLLKSLVISLFLMINAAVFAQCVIPITEGQSYVENFDDGTMECWTVDATGAGTWAVMTGTQTNVAAFQNAEAGDEARLISPTFDMSGVGSATFSFSYAMMGLYDMDELVVSYRSSETDSWHTLGTYSVSDYQNFFEETFTLTDLSATYQVSFLGRGLGGYMIFVDNIEIAGEGGCARPVSLNATDISASSALLGWSMTGNEESWVIDLNGQMINADTQPFTVSNLEPQTDYTFSVKAICGGGDESEWATPTTFKTLCDVIVVTDDEPYFDDFEASDNFVCWQTEIVSGIDNWVIDPGYLIVNNTAFFIWLGGEAMLISTPLDITAVTNPVLRFNHKQLLGLNYGTVDQLIVGYRTDKNDSWHTLVNFTEATTDWETVTIPLPNPSEAYQIVFNGIGHDAEGVYVDDVRVGNYIDDGLAESQELMASVMPNPTNGKITVSTNLSIGNVAVFDIVGKQVASSVIVDGQAEIDLSGYANGVYFIKISDESSVKTVKIVKN